MTGNKLVPSGVPGSVIGALPIREVGKFWQTKLKGIRETL
jgi:hypothetical protein